MTTKTKFFGTILMMLLAIFIAANPVFGQDCKSPNEKNMVALLAAMDYDLNQIESGKDPCGSFTDYFAVNGWYAIKAGASRAAVNQRVDRLIALAEKKIYLSGYEEGLVKDGGTAAIRKYMDGIIKEGVIETTKDAVSVPGWVQAQLAKMSAGKSVECNSTFGHGTGVYHLATGHDIPFYWYSYSNSDGWEQIALTTRVHGYDLRDIRSLRDQLGRRGIYNGWASDDFTWIGLSNDLWVKDDLTAKYAHVSKWTTSGGGKTGEYAYHRAELKRDYLDRLTAVTGGHLRFNMAELQ